jgi:large subunit ribosomal protein L29
MTMDADKIRNLTDAELKLQERDLNDQLFRLKFQLKMGQTESLKKIRGLRKDVARVKTIMREKERAGAAIPGTESVATAAEARKK